MKFGNSLKKYYRFAGIRYPFIQIILIVVFTGTAVLIAINTYADIYSVFDCKTQVVDQKVVAIIDNLPEFELNDGAAQWSNTFGTRQKADVISYDYNNLVLELGKSRTVKADESVKVFIKTGTANLFVKVKNKLLGDKK